MATRKTSMVTSVSKSTTASKVEIKEETGFPPEPTPEPEDPVTTRIRKVLEEGIVQVVKGGQKYKIGSRQLERADLKQLKDLYDDFLAKEEAAQDLDGSNDLLGNTVVSFFDRR